MVPGQIFRPEVVVGAVKIKPLYLQEVENRLPVEMKEKYKNTGRIDFGDGEVILTDFDCRRFEDKGKLFAVYLEAETDKMVSIQEIVGGMENPDYVGYSVAKNLNSAAWTWMRSIEDLQNVITFATEITELEKMCDQKVGGEIMRRRIKDKKVFLPKPGSNMLEGPGVF